MQKQSHSQKSLYTLNQQLTKNSYTRKTWYITLQLSPILGSLAKQVNEVRCGHPDCLGQGEKSIWPNWVLSNVTTWQHVHSETCLQEAQRRQTFCLLVDWLLSYRTTWRSVVREIRQEDSQKILPMFNREIELYLIWVQCVKNANRMHWEDNIWLMRRLSCT